MNLPFKKGEKVVYPAHGVAVIEDIQMRVISGTERNASLEFVTTVAACCARPVVMDSGLAVSRRPGMTRGANAGNAACP